MICPTFDTPEYIFFADGVSPLVYYSHFSSILVALFIGIFIYLNNREAIVDKFLFYISLVFSIWTLLSLITWTSNESSLIMFSWSLDGLIYISICILVFYFFYNFVEKRNLDFFKKFILFALAFPAVLLTTSKINLTGFDLIGCTAVEAASFTYYYYSVGLFIFSWVLLVGYKKYKQTLDNDLKRNIIAITFGVELFLIMFFINGFIASYLFNAGIVSDYSIDQYGLFGMTFFMGVLAYMIVKYKAFNIKLIGTQALVVALWFLVGSLIFVAVSSTTRVIAVITLVFTTIAGYFLVRSVKREVALREQVEELVIDLAKANDRLKELDKMKSEFVSIASHQLRSPLTSIRGYASMLVEGSYGKLPAKALEALQNIADSSMYMVRSVEDYLSVSRIEAGNMKYEMSDFSLKETAERLVDELRAVAIKKGLVLVFRSDCSGNGMIHADIGKTRQVLQNLIDNSMKYTPKGTITVIAHDDVKKKKMYVTIHDTGVGMSQETLEEVFDKFVRAKNANSINVTGTGLGLFVAKKMVDSMGGKVWAESEGEGKGSIFHVEFPLVAGKAGK